MINRNEKSPLTRSASGQENGTAIEARGLSSAVNGKQTENLSQGRGFAPAPADERAAFSRYTEWLHLRTHREWSNGVPAWARDHTGRMNDFTAAIAVIEELAAARASSANETVDIPSAKNC
ncbi:hypothetical protein [Burkholderia sola]|uniref:hypothetical protein n=1 Tax=Burkholderia sola TaxID=2843302 RepID=UPI0023DDAB2B|nr:hypothetical protein [Burkholderia sola]MDF3081088.1 hypothetical protein [Burkholderia sola]